MKPENKFDLKKNKNNSNLKNQEIIPNFIDLGNDNNL